MKNLFFIIFVLSGLAYATTIRPFPYPHNVLNLEIHAEYLSLEKENIASLYVNKNFMGNLHLPSNDELDKMYGSSGNLNQEMADELHKDYKKIFNPNNSSSVFFKIKQYIEREEADLDKKFIMAEKYDGTQHKVFKDQIEVIVNIPGHAPHQLFMATLDLIHSLDLKRVSLSSPELDIWR